VDMESENQLMFEGKILIWLLKDYKHILKLLSCYLYLLMRFVRNVSSQKTNISNVLASEKY